MCARFYVPTTTYSKHNHRHNRSFSYDYDYVDNKRLYDYVYWQCSTLTFLDTRQCASK